MKKRIVTVLSAILFACIGFNGCSADPSVSTANSISSTAATSAPVPVTTAAIPETTVLETAPAVDSETLQPPIISDLLAGFGRVDISPQDAVPLRGYGNTSKRLSTNIQDPLYATCVALTDANGNTVLLFAMDLTSSNGDVIGPIRKNISLTTGVPVDSIMVSCSHNHSSPDLFNTEIRAMAQYIQSLKTWMLDAAQQALADQSPAKLYTASIETTGLNFVRRYVLQNGTFAGDNYGDFNSSPIAGHESEVDSQLQLIKLERGRSQDIILANFQTHPHRAGGSKNTNVTSDLIGPFREKLEAELDCHVAYFTGGSGNVNPSSRISSENATKDYREQGERLARYAEVALKQVSERETGNVQATKTVFIGQVNHSQDHLLDLAREIQKVWTTTGNYSTCVSMGKPHGISSPYHANAIITKSGMPETQNFEIHALSIGDVAFVAAPYEMFDSNGKEIKEGSPFAMTFVMTCANTSEGYIPSALGWKNGGYSVDTTRWASGTAEKLVSSYLTMLNQLHSTK